jgi:bacterioferritin-associated ferredoxin
MYVCLCNGVTERAVREAAASGARDLATLRSMTGCASTCGSCADLAMEIVRDELKAKPLGLRLYAVAA